MDIEVALKIPRVRELPLGHQGATEALPPELDRVVVDEVVVLRDTENVVSLIGFLDGLRVDVSPDLQSSDQLLVGEVQLKAQREEIERLSAGVSPRITEVEIEREETVDLLGIRSEALGGSAIPDQAESQLGEVA